MDFNTPFVLIFLSLEYLRLNDGCDEIRGTL
jgi:hypothetical protein